MAPPRYVDVLPKKWMKSGQQTVSSPGTAVALTTDDYEVAIIKALSDNADSVWVGNDGNDDVTASNGLELQPGEGVTLETTESIYLDASSGGDGVSFIVLRRFSA